MKKKEKDEQVKEFLMQKMMQRWVDDNPDMMADIHELTSQVLFFNAKWGTKLQAEDVVNKDLMK